MAGGGLRDDTVDQLVVTLRFADEPGTAPVVRRQVPDEFGPGLVTEGTRTFPRSVAVAWSEDDVAAALRALTAEVLLAAMPDDHGSRGELSAAAAAGRHLLAGA